MIIRRNKIKLICGLAVTLNMMSCSGNKLSETSGANLNSKSISAKSFLSMSRADQQKIVDQYQTSCAVPMLFPMNDEKNLGQYSRDSISCIKVCRLNSTAPTALNASTYTETTQLIIGVENLKKYVEQDDADAISDVIGDCLVQPTCYESLPIEPQSLDKDHPINPIAPIGNPIYCVPGSGSTLPPSSGSSSPPSFIGPPVSVGN